MRVFFSKKIQFYPVLYCSMCESVVCVVLEIAFEAPLLPSASLNYFQSH